MILYPMIALSGLFFPTGALPAWLRVVAFLFPTTHAVALMHGVWDGAAWLAHWENTLMLIVRGAVFPALSSRVFRWE